MLLPKVQHTVDPLIDPKISPFPITVIVLLISHNFMRNSQIIVNVGSLLQMKNKKFILNSFVFMQMW